MRTSNRLFVYGTLRRDSRNSRFGLFGRQARFLGRARMRGRLVDLGEYPGLIPSGNTDDWVRGEVYALNDPGDTLLRLDEYEGCAAESSTFRRELGHAVLDSGRKLSVWVYVYTGAVPRKGLIASGDYLHGSHE